MARKSSWQLHSVDSVQDKWEFPKIRGTLFGVESLVKKNDEDPTIQGTMLGSPIFGNPQMSEYVCRPL